MKQVQTGISKKGTPYTRIITDTIPSVCLFTSGNYDFKEGDTVRIIELIGGMVKNYYYKNQWRQQTTFACRLELGERNYTETHAEEYLWEDSDDEEYLWR